MRKTIKTFSGHLKSQTAYLGLFKNKPLFSGSGCQEYEQLSRALKYLLRFAHLKKKKKQGYWKQSDEGGSRQEEEETNSDLTLNPVTTL